VLNGLGQELAGELSNTLIIPLGKVAAEVVDFLVSERRLNAARCLFGFPHPSPANGQRKQIFEANRSAMQEKVGAWFSRNR